jgi:four helix bundle protein
MVRDVRPIADRIAEHDRDQARQLERSSVSVVLNVAEGYGARAGNKRLRYETALGSARETLANLEVGVAVGYVTLVPAARVRPHRIIGTLVKRVY